MGFLSVYLWNPRENFLTFLSKAVTSAQALLSLPPTPTRVESELFDVNS